MRRDPRSLAVALELIRTNAVAAATSALRDLGFSELVGQGRWRGSLNLQRANRELPVEILLPREFPDSLPEVYVNTATLGRLVPHVDNTGKVCIAPTTNVLLDATRPRDLIHEALQHAVTTLDAGLNGESDQDLAEEFFAYWRTNAPQVLSLCAMGGGSRIVILSLLHNGPGGAETFLLLADSQGESEAWAKNIGATVEKHAEAFFLPLDSGFLPTKREWKVADVWRLFTGHASQDAVRRLSKYCEGREGSFIAVSLPPASTDSGERLIAFQLPAIPLTTKKRLSKGFRRRRVPAALLRRAMADKLVDIPDMLRVDAAGLTARGGGMVSLGKRTVVIVGTGALGAEIACNLAAAGVGSLRVIDRESLAAENIHRHPLGMSDIGLPKAKALAAALGKRFPHLHVEYRVEKAEVLMEKEPGFILDNDVIVWATGEETLERRMAELLSPSQPCLHAWLEPLGIAGHVLHRNGPGPGCYECLFAGTSNTDGGLTNRSALVAAGQWIRRTFAGCAGSYTPFSPLDAKRTALEAAALVIEGLSAEGGENVLLTWRGRGDEFAKRGYKLSRRASVVSPGATTRLTGRAWASEMCTVCRRVG